MAENMDAELLKDDNVEQPEEPSESDAQSEPTEEPEFGGEQVSQGPSSFSSTETSEGGADAVPDTPDDVTETYVGETDATRRRG